MFLKNDLYTIYGELLVNRNVEITAPIVRRIRKIGSCHHQVRVPLRNTDIFGDFEKVFEDSRYVSMLKGPVSKKEICDIAGSLMIENDLIFELSTMKNNLPYTYHHVLVVAAFAIKLSQAHNPRLYNKEIISHCGFTHDIGKTRIPIEILNKVERLTDEESAIIRTHPMTGYLLLNYYLKSDRRDCSLASLEHHEKLDGSGYPYGIKRLNKYTKLISPVDILDALMTLRPYRKKKYSLRIALDYLLQEAAGGRLNKEVVLSLISFARKDKPDIKTIQVAKQPREPLPEELIHDK